MVSKSLIVAAIHACTGHERLVYLGGLGKMLKEAIAAELGSRGINAPNGHGRFRGLNLNNIYNRGAAKQGVQLEIARRLRDDLKKNSFRRP
jgi:phage replication-related protein YjqB (UPF0714/DUF867 family)